MLFLKTMYGTKGGFLRGSVVKNPPANARDTDEGSVPGGEDPLEGRTWQPTPVFLPGESHGQRSLADYSPWVCKKSDTTKAG